MVNCCGWWFWLCAVSTVWAQRRGSRPIAVFVVTASTAPDAVYEAPRLCVASRRWHRTDKPLKRVSRMLRWASTFTAPVRHHRVVTARVLAPSASAHRQRGGTAIPVAAAPGRKQMGGGRPHSLTASQPHSRSLTASSQPQPHSHTPTAAAAVAEAVARSASGERGCRGRLPRQRGTVWR